MLCNAGQGSGGGEEDLMAASQDLAGLAPPGTVLQVDLELQRCIVS